MTPAHRGLVAATSALVVTYASGLLAAVPYPPDALVSIVVRATPGDLATRSIETIGHWALRLLVVGTHLSLLAIAAAGSALVHRSASPSRRAQAALFSAGVAFTGASLAAFFSGKGVGLAAFVVYAVSSLLFARLMLGSPLMDVLQPDLQSDETPLDAMQRSRRRFVFRGAAVIAGMLVSGAGILRLFTQALPVDVRLVDPDVRFDEPPADPSFPEIKGLTPEFTANEDFYTVDINYIKPRIDHRSWKLQISGRVGRRLELDYEQLQSEFEVVDMPSTLTCVSNEVGGDLISTTIWRGVRLADVLKAAETMDGVADVVFHAADGYSDSISVDKAMDPTTLIAFGMNGSPLPREHGFPARIIAPNIYGMKNVKWLERIEALDVNHKGYWQQRGWSDTAVVKTHSRVDVPQAGAKVAHGDLVGGVAWAGDRGVSLVEFSQDGGRTWRPAQLKREISRRVWRLWVAELEPADGDPVLLVRAADGTGATQAEARVAAHPDGAEGYHRVDVKFVK